MKISIYGCGYVGLVTAACLAEVGHNVLCLDVDEARIDQLNKGHVPIHEPGLDELLRGALNAGHIFFTSDYDRAVAHSGVHMIAVGTPPDEDGSADLSHVLAVARSIAQRLVEPVIVITKSTVPVGTGDMVEREFGKVLAERGVETKVSIVSNPEFLKEGMAIEDFTRPDRIVIGTDSEEAGAVMRELYAPFARNHEKIMLMDRRSAELTKYAANAFLATRISFMNEMAAVAEQVGADIENVRRGIGSDQRIGYAFLYAGCGYGGSCFPKDVRALIHTAEGAGVQPDILHAVEHRNLVQKDFLFKRIRDHFKGDLKGRVIALWGLAFKPGTDDMREAPSGVLMEALWKQGAVVRAHDPAAMKECQRIYGDRDDLVFCDSSKEALDGADALAIVTEWKAFRALDHADMRTRMKELVIFDGRNLFDPELMAQKGVVYHSVGRPSIRLPE